MGQRVNIILAVENKENKKKVYVYHDQWGIGRKSLLNLISIHHAFYNKAYDKSITETANLDPSRSGVHLEYEFNYGKNNKQDENDEVKYKFDDFLVPDKAGDFIDEYCDNNNGAMVVYIKESESTESWKPDVDFKCGFLLGHEDEYKEYDGKEYNAENAHLGKAFHKYLSLEEWCKLSINSSYADKDFKNIVKSYMQYFNIKEF